MIKVLPEIQLIKISFLVFFITSCAPKQPEQKDADPIMDAVEFVLPENAIPIDYNRHLVFWGTYNDSIKAKWVFDTGCPYAVVDSSFYSECGYDMDDIIKAFAFGAGNNASPAYIIEKCHSVETHGFRSAPEHIHLLDLREAVGDKTADGILAVDFFGLKVLEINYQNEYFRVLPDTFEPDSSWAFLPFVFKKNRILVDGSVQIEEGMKIKGPFILDLGSTRTFTLNKKACREINIQQTSKKVDTLDFLNSGVGGNATSGMLRADFCSFAGFHIDDVPVDFRENDRGAFSDATNYGVLGNAFLDRFDLIIDFVNSRLLLRPNSHFNEPYRKVELSGMFLLDRSISKGGFEINGIIRQSKADSSGFQLGDLIIAIDGKKVKLEENSRAVNRMIDSLAMINGVELSFLRGDSLCHYHMQ